MPDSSLSDDLTTHSRWATSVPPNSSATRTIEYQHQLKDKQQIQIRPEHEIHIKPTPKLTLQSNGIGMHISENTFITKLLVKKFRIFSFDDINKFVHSTNEALDSHT
ncbi:hypothetical protein BI364_04115 [Acidihalobacter yilgarnensis]|uniref:Uncharacterized protein n=1 Tax=Acidihalobacter yilgarnensis TaxID=2819280 RepID=A0A1D8ILH3_9GAMM|nr:hypothetical protein BI364_04115 [Acidihalobacter yilgarnensis]